MDYTLLLSEINNNLIEINDNLVASSTTSNIINTELQIQNAKINSFIEFQIMSIIVIFVFCLVLYFKSSLENYKKGV